MASIALERHGRSQVIASSEPATPCRPVPSAGYVRDRRNSDRLSRSEAVA